MLTILISMIFFPLLFMILSKFKNIGECVLGGVFVGLIIGFVSAGTVQATIKERWVNKYIYELKQLQLDRTWSGTFFLGCGSIGEDDYYYFYCKYPSGLIKLKKRNVFDCYIVESNTASYNIQKRIPIEKYEKRSYLFGIYPSQERHVFYIPDGSIKNQININLK